MLEPNPTKWPFYRCHFAIFSIFLLAFVLPVSQQWEIDDAIARIAAAEWPRFRKSWDDDAERSFMRQQQANSPSWSISYASPTADEGRQVRPYHRHFFAVPRFARPPDPQTLWKDQMMAGNGKEALEPFGGGGSQPPMPQAIRNYFALDAPPEKVVKELTGIDMRSLLGPALDQLVETTAAPTWTRATTPKDKLVQYFERSLDDFLSGRLPAMERIPYLAEKEKLLSESNVAEIEEAAGNSTKNETNKQADEPAEGSGEAPEESQQQQQQPSSIAGIPKQMPFIPKVPPRFGRQQDSEIMSKAVEEMRPPPPLLENPFRLTITNAGEETSAKEIRRHPGMAKAKGEEEKMTRMKLAEEELLLAKTMEEDFQYGQKPSRQQGVLGSLLDFFGINSPRSGTELDQVITDWLMEHSPKHRSKMEKRTNQQSSYNQLKQLLSQPLMPLCSPQPEVVANFQVDAFMGQWFEVMSPSPLVASPSCTIISYRMLSRNGAASGVGSVFQTMQLSLPKQPKKSPTTAATAFDGAFEQHFVPSSPTRLTSGYAIVSRPGQMLFRKSDSPEEVQVQVIDAGYSTDRKRYEWAILGINCNFPLHVIARDPLLFKQKYERLVVQMLERRGLVSELSRLLNLVAGVDPDSCRVPANFFA